MIRRAACGALALGGVGALGLACAVSAWPGDRWLCTLPYVPVQVYHIERYLVFTPHRYAEYHYAQPRKSRV
ncbi:MAG: hypothetical protein PVJ57_21715 [Phycisphaerae bacterium]